MFDKYSNVQHAGRLLKAHYPNLTVMLGVEHTVSSFFNDISNILFLNQMISDQNMIYNSFGSGIYQKPHSIFKHKYQEFHNRNIDIFSGNETRMAGYFMCMHRDLWMRKVLQSTTSSAVVFSITINTKLFKEVRYIHNNNRGRTDKTQNLKNAEILFFLLVPICCGLQYYY